MCNRYTTPDQLEIERFWHIGRGRENRWWDDEAKEIFPLYQAPFVRRARHDPGYSREAVVGRWGLVPWWWKKDLSEFKGSTNNAKSEELAVKVSYKGPWARGQRCIIPATAFVEPYWGPFEAPRARTEWWSFRRADGDPWGLAGLWEVWRDPKTGEELESYTMLTIDAAAHPLLSRMHKHDKDLPADKQVRRGVIPIELADVDQWLQGTVQEASALLKLAPAEVFEAGPV
jgi:putative SOS response-associated peptidase YedK